MTVKIVTDSLSDITSDVAEEFGITVVPLTVLFGREAFLDRITITTDEFYRRLIHEDILPTTTQPTPAAFAAVYNKLAQETDEILVVTLSSKLSGTYQSATAAVEMADRKARIEVIDSQAVAMGLGLVVISAARRLREGATLDELTQHVREALQRMHFAVYFDTLKYLAKGGRIGKAQGLLGAMLSFKPILTVKDGEMSPVTRKRSRAAGVQYLCELVNGFSSIEDIAVEHSTSPEVAEELIKQLNVPADKVRRAVVSPVLGTYAGPDALAVSVLASKGAG